MSNPSTLSLPQLNQLTTESAQQWFSHCCASTTWCHLMTQSRPYQDLPALYHHAQQHWQQCNERDYLMAFEAHPMIGDVSSLRKKFAATKQMASNEQQGASQANEQTLALLAQANQAYLTKHSFIFIICASGLSANTMLNALNLRLANATATEIELAALEQIKITLLRLKKGLQE